MAAFSYQPHPFLLDFIFWPNMVAPLAPNKVSGFLMGDGNFDSNCFSPFYPPEPVQDSLLLDPKLHESSCLLDHSSNVVVAHSDNAPSVSVAKKHSTDDSTVVDKLESGEQVTQNVTLKGRKRRTRNGTSFKPAKSKGAKERKIKDQKKCNDALKNENKDKKKSAEEPPAGFIHVRARRGQATDSHSLAERVRRKKISERMKILQCLVPGCEKVTGKALMLDEIINYVQSLQNQVEFLSMRLASVNPMLYDFGGDLETLMVKPEVFMNSLTSTPELPSLQHCNPTQPSAFVDSTTSNFAPANNYPLLDASTSLIPPLQNNGSVLWDVEDQRQKFLNSSGLNDNLCSFN